MRGVKRHRVTTAGGLPWDRAGRHDDRKESPIDIEIWAPGSITQHGAATETVDFVRTAVAAIRRRRPESEASVWLGVLAVLALIVMTVWEAIVLAH